MPGVKYKIKYEWFDFHYIFLFFCFWFNFSISRVVTRNKIALIIAHTKMREIVGEKKKIKAIAH